MTAPYPHFALTIRQPRWLTWSIYIVTACLLLSGITWLILHFWFQQHGEFGDTINPLEPWALRVHGLAMLLGLFLYGSLLRTHMTRAWHVRRNRVTGVIVSSIIGILTLTGYLLYYSADESVRPFISVAHWAIGLCIAVMLPFHILHGRKR